MAVITSMLAAFIPVVVLYYVMNIRLQELEKRFKRVEDGIDYVFEELSDIRMLEKPHTQTLSTSAPAVMVSAPKPRAKRAKKAK